jgi:hypothetical protein
MAAVRHSDEIAIPFMASLRDQEIPAWPRVHPPAGHRTANAVPRLRDACAKVAVRAGSLTMARRLTENQSG